MWRILIADDEPKIQRGLKGQIERMGLDACVVGVASDGEVALEMAGELSPDIMLVDICMPFINGLDMIERLRRQNKDARMIIVTGYEEFAYAKRALEYDVTAYLLKPVEVDELRSAIEQAIVDLAAKRESGRYLTWAVSQLVKRKDALREEFLRDLITEAPDHDEFPEQSSFFGLDVIKNPALILIQIAPSEDELPVLRRMAMRYAVEGAVSNAFKQCQKAFAFSDDKGNLLYLYDFDEGGGDNLCELARIAAQAELGVKTEVVFARCESLEKLTSAYDALIELLDSRAQSSVAEAARRYILNNYSRVDLSLDEVAENAGVNPSYLSRLMKQSIGMSFSKYLTTVRVGKAMQLMKDQRLLLKDIALMVGYASPFYFSTAFKRALGVSPAKYRDEAEQL